MKKRVPKGSAVKDGNTKSSPRISPSLRWCFTWNNYLPGLSIQQLNFKFREICEKYVFQPEIGKNGTKHLQGAIWLKKKARPTQFGLPKAIHWEIMRNEEASEKYCQKSDTNDGEIHKWGWPVELEIIKELRPWQSEIEKLTKEKPDGRTIHWYWEAKGGVGKSAFCRYMYYTYGAIVIQGGNLADIMNIMFNANMNDIKTVIIDIPRKKKNKVSYSSIECILNGMITNTKYETGVKIFNPPHVIVFANSEPEEESLSEDRWKITEIR